MRIIPVRVGNARMPKLEELPESIRPLLARQGVRVRSDPDFRTDVSRLIRQLRESIPKFKAEPAQKIRRRQASTVATASQTVQFAATPLSDTDLEKLIQWTKKGDVVPVLGPSLLEMEINGRVVQVTRHFAEVLAQRLGVAADPNAQRPFEDLIARFVGAGGKTGRFLITLRKVLDITCLPLPSSVHALVEITAFSLFITSSFDQILESALREMRSVDPSSISYSPNSPSDLNIAGSTASRPTVFHLCGRPEFSPNSCAVTSDEWQIFVEALTSPERQPWRLIAELRERVLLF